MSSKHAQEQKALATKQIAAIQPALHSVFGDIVSIEKKGGSTFVINGIGDQVDASTDHMIDGMVRGLGQIDPWDGDFKIIYKTNEVT